MSLLYANPSSHNLADICRLRTIWHPRDFAKLCMSYFPFFTTAIGKMGPTTSVASECLLLSDLQVRERSSLGSDTATLHTVTSVLLP